MQQNLALEVSDEILEERIERNFLDARVPSLQASEYLI